MPDRLLGCLRGVESLVVIAVVLVAAGPVAGQTGESRNAATWYQTSFDRLGSIDITDAEWTAIREFQRDPHGAPSVTVRAVLARVEPVLSAARSGCCPRPGAARGRNTTTSGSTTHRASN
jgi:hypothetical protein